MESRLSVVRTNRLSSHGRQHFVQELNEVWRLEVKPRSKKGSGPDRSGSGVAYSRDGEWNERLNPERRNLRPDVALAIERRPSIMKAAVQQQQQQRRPGPTNPIAVGPAKTTASTTTTPTASSRIPRLLFNVSAGTPHRVGAYVGASPDSSGTMMDHNDSSLDLSQIGHNRSSTCSSQSSNSSLIVASKPSRLLPPGSIVSAKLAAHYQVGRRSHLVQQQSSVRTTAAVSALHKPTIKSKLPVATSSVSKCPECRSTRSLPEGSTRTRVTSATTRGTPPPPAITQQQPNNGRPKNVARSVVPSTSSLRKTTTTTPDRGSVSKKKPTNNNIAVGLQKKEDEGGMECVSARGGGEISRGSQGKPEGSLSDLRITPPPPPPPLLPDGVDNHLENNVTDSLLSQSAKSEESTTTSASASESSGLSSIPSSFNLHPNSHGTKVESVVLIRQSESMAASGRPVSYHESSQEKWTVRMSIPAAESSELLTRLECERRSIRGTYLDEAPSVAADVELMELLERDILISQQPTTPPDESVENPQRSLSLPKSFLATKYGLIGFKAALPSLKEFISRQLIGNICPVFTYERARRWVKRNGRAQALVSSTSLNRKWYIRLTNNVSG
ncbi:hypothetical protein DAPPUDRAFT_252505 [Daphnia pulex]|uniref:Uncharacterized protein n=1 Tax=Daphnia pulex TaxID=6669 RepID=E9H2U5_DAPPU|nr:hypothetical protein DAPPUDRAFT_252505 [Daphnia pulex]|eukprot:EFX73842.1 hypothetical protein DAPPUDRAFT_252505 [Daphnia pulex]